MAVVGGTASELGGGKFSNGAVAGAYTHMFNAEMKAYLKSLNVRQVTKVGEYMTQIKKMNLSTFNKTFDINVTGRLEMMVYKQNIYDQLANYSISKGLYDSSIQAVEDIASPRSALAPVKAVYHLIGPSGDLGYDFVKGSTTLKGIYEIN